MRHLFFIIALCLPGMLFMPGSALANSSSTLATEGWQEARIQAIRQVRARKMKIENQRRENPVAEEVRVELPKGYMKGPRHRR